MTTSIPKQLSSSLKSLVRGVTLRRLFLIVCLLALLLSITLLFVTDSAHSNKKAVKNKDVLDKVMKKFDNPFMERFIQNWLNHLFVFESPPHWRAPYLEIDELFPRRKQFEAHWKDIRDEALAVCNNRSKLIRPYQDVAPRAVKSLINYAKQVGDRKIDYWKTVILRFYNQQYPEVIAACPKTAAVLEKFPEIEIAMFSVMEPGATIPVHRGILRSVFRYHLPLIVPGYDLEGRPNTPRYNESQGQVSIVIGEDLSKQLGVIRQGRPTNMINLAESREVHETRRYYWEPGQGMLFDDTYAHSVLNHHPSNRRRIVLLCDLRRPVPPGALGIGSALFSLLKWTGIPELVFYWNGKREKAVYRTKRN